MLTTPWLATHRQYHCDESIAGCRGVIVEPAILIHVLGVNDSVLLLLQANDEHSESIVSITSHLHVRFFQYLLVGSAYSNHIAVWEYHSKMCSVPKCSQRFLLLHNEEPGICTPYPILCGW